MKNYAEELAYWYFRFNGLFILNNYVIHRGGIPNIIGLNRQEAGAHSEADILGIRPNFVDEGVGYPEHQSKVLNAIIPNNTTMLGLICEIKAGENDLPSNANLESQIKRLGLINYNDELLDRLQHYSFYHNVGQGISIIKILIRRRDDEEPSWNIIRIDQIISFIEERFLFLEEHKIGGWDKFDSNLMQFILTYGNNV